MTMNNSIDPLGTNKISQPESQGTQAINKRKYRSEEDTSSESLGDKDSASLSVQARLLAKARLALDDTSDVRNELVNKIRERILSGRYEVPYEKLAELIAKRLG
jgi:flagellar biosynthesis anti-sigma factor FlgM